MCQANPSPATSSSSHPRVIEGRAGCARVKQPRTSTSTLHGSSTPLKWIRGMPSKSPRCSYIRASASTSSYRSLRSLALINEWIFLFINSNLMATRAPVWSSWPSYLHCANSQTMMCQQRTRLTVGSYTPPKPPRPISLRSFHLRTDEGASGSLFFTFFITMLLHRRNPRSFTATSGEFLGQGISRHVFLKVSCCNCYSHKFATKQKTKHDSREKDNTEQPIGAVWGAVS